MENLFEKGNEVHTKHYGIRKIHEAGIVGKGEADKGKLFISFMGMGMLVGLLYQRKFTRRVLLELPKL